MVIYTGQEGGPNIPAPFGNPFFDFDRNTIETLLNRPHAGGKEIAGLRFHFEINGQGTTPDRLFGIGVTVTTNENFQLHTAEIFTPGSPDYIPNEGNPITRAQFEPIVFGANGDKFRTCVYFSKAVLQDGILNASTQRSGIRLFLVPFDSQHQTLTAIGLNNGMLDGNFFRSEMPCPPSCGSDY